ncbi:MAG: CooT family nickel-binding protein [Desulfobacteraceae bacterium]
MCEANAFLLKEGMESKVMENVDQLDVEGDEIRLVNIFGEQKKIKARIISYNGSDSRLLLESIA